MDLERLASWKVIPPRVQDFIRRHVEILRHQGSVCAAPHDSRRYFRLFVRYGPAKRLHGLYLGKSAAVARAVEALLMEIQGPHRRERAARKVERHLRRQLRAAKRDLDRALAQVGMVAKGFAFRGLRRLRRRAPGRTDVSEL